MNKKSTSEVMSIINEDCDDCVLILMLNAYVKWYLLYVLKHINKIYTYYQLLDTDLFLTNK